MRIFSLLKGRVMLVGEIFVSIYVYSSVEKPGVMSIYHVCNSLKNLFVTSCMSQPIAVKTLRNQVVRCMNDILFISSLIPYLLPTLKISRFPISSLSRPKHLYFDTALLTVSPTCSAFPFNVASLPPKFQ